MSWAYKTFFIPNIKQTKDNQMEIKVGQTYKCGDNLVKIVGKTDSTAYSYVGVLVHKSGLKADEYHEDPSTYGAVNLFSEDGDYSLRGNSKLHCHLKALESEAKTKLLEEIKAMEAKLEEHKKTVQTMK